MKAAIAFSLVLPACFLLKPQAAFAGGGFTASCQNITLFTNVDRSGSADLNANCRTSAGKLSGTAVNLNTSIVNVDGRLAWLKNGGFGGSTRNCNLEVHNVTTLHCQAAKRDGSWVNASITLDDEVANYDGHLTVIDGF
ncbi:MAG: CVNH domain-containing protein [Chroococcidiopsidaceae cyanobacterium CP_BM_RX_35]|nr:CVNH domain-containing protein [Chroococcidiopsidaceae cyanobacterium CP_BM_RX_35]